MTEHEEEHNQARGFRVVDRRRFNSEGEARSDVPDPVAAASAPAVVAAPPPAAAKPVSPAPQAAPQPQPATPPAARREPVGPPPSMDFLSFAASLATNALAAMGALPEAQARGLPKNAELAREYIEILAMLQYKTQGNLTPEEDAAMRQMVTELKMHFVEATQKRK